MTTIASPGSALPSPAWRSSRAACGSNGSDDAGTATTAAASAATAAGADGAGHRRQRRSASSSSARRTTSATTRPPTRAARRSPRRYPDLEVLTAENVPETDKATRVMESMIDKGAKIIFATSYGHLDPAHEGRRRPPRRGRRAAGQHHHRAPCPPNAGTYFGTVYEPVYLAGIAAGKATKSNKLGYVYAFPIPQTIANINAFELGRQVGEPRRRRPTWSTPRTGATRPSRPRRPRACSPRASTCITQHQDCTGDDHQGRRGGRHDGRRLPRRRLGARPEGLDHRFRVGLGRPLHRHRRRRRSPASSPAASTTPTTGSATRTATTRSCSRRTAPTVTDDDARR